jgi:hypothetical protein
MRGSSALGNFLRRAGRVFGENVPQLPVVGKGVAFALLSTVG